MKNIKCLNCGLTNWSKSGFCIRCKSSLENSASPNIDKNLVKVRFPHDYLTVFKRVPHNIICVSCLCLIICVLGYQITKSDEAAKFSDERPQILGTEPLSKDNSTYTSEELDVRSIDKEMINRDAMEKFNSGGVSPGSTVFEVTLKNGLEQNYRQVEKNATGCSNKA